MAETVNILNSNDAAALIGIKPTTLRFWRFKGRGPKFIKLGRSKQAGVAYLESDIVEWRNARMFASTSAASVSHPESTHPECSLAKFARSESRPDASAQPEIAALRGVTRHG